MKTEKTTVKTTIKGSEIQAKRNTQSDTKERGCIRRA